MIDYNKYVGIPWKCGQATLKGADCWGLVCMVYYEKFGIKLNHFSVRSIDDNFKTMLMIEDRKINDSRWEMQEKPIEGDVVMMYGKVNKRPVHVGIFIDGDKILHSLERDVGTSSIHKLSVLQRMFYKLEFYCYVG